MSVPGGESYTLEGETSGSLLVLCRLDLGVGPSQGGHVFVLPNRRPGAKSTARQVD